MDMCHIRNLTHLNFKIHRYITFGLVLSCTGVLQSELSFEEGGLGNVLLNFLWQAKVGESQTPFQVSDGYLIQFYLICFSHLMYLM